MRNFDLSPLMRQWIGFDKLANALQNAGESQSFPPYNIEKSDDNHYRITLALAGFRQEDFRDSTGRYAPERKRHAGAAKRREKMAASRAYESAI
ncbi:small heat shock protein B [Escherichia coli]|nr:small heat shock protein B [Escherichia coli]